MIKGVTFILCCHNSTARLQNTLKHLSQMKKIPGLDWEVLLIDNASTDDTSELAVKLWPEEAHGQLRIVNEPRLGLKYARETGIENSTHDIITFVDDDNWLSVDWLSIVEEVMGNNPVVAVCGGVSEPAFEMAPPPWFRQHERFYALGEQNSFPGDVTSSDVLFWGAGLVLRKSAWTSNLRQGFRSHLSDRTGKTLLGGHDMELCKALKLAGWRLWYEPRLTLRHFIPSGRLQWPYFRHLMRGMGRSSVGLDAYNYCLDESWGILKRLRFTWFYQVCSSLNNLARLIYLGLFHSRRLCEGDPRVGECEYAFGRLLGLIGATGSYHSMIRRVVNAPWNLRGGGSSRSYESQPPSGP